MFFPPMNTFGTVRRPLIRSRFDLIFSSSPGTSMLITKISDFSTPSICNISNACTQYGHLDFENMTTGCVSTIVLIQSRFVKSLHSRLDLSVSFDST